LEVNDEQETTESVVDHVFEEVVVLTAPVATPLYVRRLAQVLRRLTPAEISQLVQLVPELERARSPWVIEEEREAIAYFRRAALEMTGGTLPSPQDEFIEGLTYEAYFALPEEKQDALWERIFAEEEPGPYDLEEHDAQPGARVAARQERRSQDD
jgi:hypothetical protein